MLDNFYVAHRVAGDDNGTKYYQVLHPYPMQEWETMVNHVMKKHRSVVLYPAHNHETVTFASSPEDYYIAVFEGKYTIEYRGFWTKEEADAFLKGEI